MSSSSLMMLTKSTYTIITLQKYAYNSTHVHAARVFLDYHYAIVNVNLNLKTRSGTACSSLPAPYSQAFPRPAASVRSEAPR